MTPNDPPIAPAGAEYVLRPDVAFLNHGSFGACPRPVLATQDAWRAEMEAEPVAFIQRRMPAAMAAARARLGEYIGADGDDLVFVPNATHGVNIVARSLALGPGDEVLGNNHEYGAAERAWRFAGQRTGAVYVRRPVPLPVGDPDDLADHLLAGVTPRTKVLFLSHITAPTALIFPVAQVCRRARERGILTVVDGAHTPGQIALDLAALGADFYTGNCHKWLCGPKGSAFLYARREVQSLLQPLVVRWGWESATPGPSRFQDELGFTGTQDFSAYLSVPAAIDFQARHDWPAVRAACRALLAEARDRVAALTRLPEIAPDDPAWWMQFAACPLPPGDATALQRRLFDEFLVEAPIVEWEGRQFVRISMQAYNRRSDVDRLIAALAACLR